MPPDPRIAVVIPAHGGAGGSPGWSLKRLGSESLLSWAIAIGREVSGSIGTFVSADNDQASQEARRKGANVLRFPSGMSRTGAIDAHLEAWEAEGALPDIIVYLKPTSPFRSVGEVQRCLARLRETGADAVATFRPLSFHPSWLLTVGQDGTATGMLDSKEAWNGAVDGHSVFAMSGEVHLFDLHAYRRQSPPDIYFGNASHIIKDGFSIDITTHFDLATARRLVAEQADVLGLDPALLKFISAE